MSSLEDKLSASMQSPRRGSTAAGAAEKESKPAVTKPTRSSGTQSKDPAAAKGSPPVEDLNAGGGRSLNPPRIWPD